MGYLHSAFGVGSELLDLFGIYFAWRWELQAVLMLLRLLLWLGAICSMLLSSRPIDEYYLHMSNDGRGRMSGYDGCHNATLAKA